MDQFSQRAVESLIEFETIKLLCTVVPVVDQILVVNAMIALEMSGCYQSRSVRFVDINSHQGLQEASGGSTEFGKGDRAPLASARIGALECRSGLSRL